MTTQALEITPEIIQKHGITPSEYEEIKKILPSMPVAILTAYYDFTQANRAFKMGACAYLEKPIDWAHFRNVVYTNALLHVSSI